MDELNIRVNNALSTFNSLQLKYNVDSIDFFINSDVSIAELMNYNEKNMLLLLTGGLKEKTLEKGKEAITKLLEVGLDLQTIHALCREKCYEQGFTLGETGMEILNRMSKDKGKQTIAVEPFLQNLASLIDVMDVGGSTKTEKTQ